MPSTRSLRRVTTVCFGPGHGDDEVVGAPRRCDGRGVALDRAEQHDRGAGEARVHQHLMARDRGDQPLGGGRRRRRASASRDPRTAMRRAGFMPAPPGGSSRGRRGCTTSWNAKRRPTASTSSAEQQPQPLAAHVLAGARAELRADHAADHQDQRQHRVDQMVGGGVHHGRRRHGDRASAPSRCRCTVAVGTRRK